MKRTGQLCLSTPLTNVANRRGFDQELERRLADWRRHGTPVHLVLFDIDCFKALNDRYGHRAGDFMLVEVAKLMKEAMRETDLARKIRWRGIHRNRFQRWYLSGKRSCRKNATSR